jgi:DNA-directed RNA polymerase specialized sigma24 family protein
MSKPKSEGELLAEISRKLDSVLAFLAAGAAQKDQATLVKRLYDNGHSADVIARVVGISENAVNIRLTRIRQKSGKSQPKVRKNDKSGTEESPAG